MPRVPDRTTFDPVLDAYLHTGDNAVEVLGITPGTAVAIDIETPGLDRAFEVKCVTLAWTSGEGKTHAALLNPVRHTPDAELLKTACHRAGSLILHNAPFDVPALWHHAFLGPDHINRIVDTLVLARMAWPNPYDPQTGDRGLSALATRLLGMENLDGGMKVAFKAAGYRTLAEGYERMDIDAPVYRLGAMADTVATLRLEPVIRRACIDVLLTHSFAKTFGATTTTQAEEIIAVTETVNRVMLRRTARGIRVDSDYLDKYTDRILDDRRAAEAELGRAGLAGGAGKAAALVSYLDSLGELPPDWPLTDTGKLKATKGLLDSLDHPLASAQRMLAETDKVLGYLTKVATQAGVTGRCHPQVGVLGASQTGRMSCSSPELQQFPADARPILVDDGQGLTSIDWSQIEPVTMGLLAKDEEFLAPYEAGQDMYAPLMKAAGIDRKTAKVVLLALMYGQGVTGMARSIGTDETVATRIRRDVKASMPLCTPWMDQVTDVAEQYGMIPTGVGRILPVDSGGSFRAVNYMVQSTAYDLLANTIVEMERQGLGDDLYLAMHDELVVSTPVADEVRRIMQTPPQWLTRAAGRTPVLRTDREDMGPTWLKV